MTVKRFLSLSHVRRIHHAPRRMHQAVAHAPPSRPAYVSAHSNDDYLRVLYEDLMTLESRTSPEVDSQKVSERLSPGPDNKLAGPASDTIDSLLAEYAKQGNARDFDLLMSRMLSGMPSSFFKVAFLIITSSVPPTEHQRDLHVKAHIVNASLSAHSSLSPTQRFPTTALAVLHRYEASGHFAPIKSYTRVISALFNVQTCPSDTRLGRTAAQAQAWDLFAHMRYVAHPVPDARLYALMIRACGSFSRPEPERALDLWMEMQENGVKPTKGGFEAVIKVCGRAGPEWLGEGMRVAREMADQYPITGVDGRHLWCALLEGCKRAGDLKKARWIFAEAVRDSGDGKDAMVDSELMTHMFHTYASYKPPFIRGTTRLIDRSTESNEEVSADESQAEGISNHIEPPHVSTDQTREGDVFPDLPVENAESMASFSRLPPQTPSDVIAETQAIFNSILQDKVLSFNEARHSAPGGIPAGRLAHVELTSVLLNAYLSVFYSHASIETSQEAFDSLFGDSSNVQVLQPDEYSYINALERCAIARAEDRHIAARWAKDVWRRWEATEATGLREGKRNVGSFARLVEKAHTAMRRVLTL